MVTSGIAARGSVTVENTVGAAVPSAAMTIQSTPVDVAITKTETNIPPFAKLIYPITMTVPNYFTGGSGRIAVEVNGQSEQYVFTIQPITAYFIIPLLCFSGILVILLALTVRKFHVWKHRKKK